MRTPNTLLVLRAAATVDKHKRRCTECGTKSCFATVCIVANHLDSNTYICSKCCPAHHLMHQLKGEQHNTIQSDLNWAKAEEELYNERLKIRRK